MRVCSPYLFPSNRARHMSINKAKLADKHTYKTRIPWAHWAECWGRYCSRWWTMMFWSWLTLARCWQRKPTSLHHTRRTCGLQCGIGQMEVSKTPNWKNSRAYGNGNTCSTDKRHTRSNQTCALQTKEITEKGHKQKDDTQNCVNMHRLGH